LQKYFNGNPDNIIGVFLIISLIISPIIVKFRHFENWPW
jgi:hypothetical protein